ncbi:site-specific integrase [Muribaculum intestinale]|jgi:site-specific recombinase XerD|uniref:site-specific integrase n=2 Tax=Muribaculum intestinale TaxID=1796646 RepID=UPI00242D493B|nr:site-specific integrase [Muribaculum intestinale]
MQQRKSTFSILFYIKRKKLLKNGDAPVYMRVTVDGRFLEASLKRGVNPKVWNEKKQRSTGRDRLSLELNDYLDDTLSKLLKIHQRFIDENKVINPKTILDEWNGKVEKPKMLCEVFKEDNKKYRQRLEIGDVVLNTVLRNERAERYLGEFIRKKYNVNDIPFSSIDNAFVRDFHLFLRVDKKQAQNTANKYCKILKRIVTLALDNKWMEINPFQGMRFQAKATNRQFLTEKELSTIMNKTFTLERLNIVRDMFVFCALTGLSFSDVEGLKPEHVSVDDDGNYWIHKARQKTKKVCSIPYLESAREIADKYKGHHLCESRGVLLPVISNQRMNSYLGEIAGICGITKPLTMHIARHSFACLALANGVSMEIIARMLGHSDIRTTKIYAKVIDKSIAEQIGGLAAKFGSQK